jgi:hypothetical protein
MKHLNNVGCRQPSCNALSQVDEILGHLSRVCPGVGGELKIDKVVLTRANECLSALSIDALCPRKNLTGSEVAGLFFTRGVFEVLYDSIPELCHVLQVEQFEFLRRVVAWPMEKFIKYAKFVTAYPMDHYLHNDEIVYPEAFQKKVDGKTNPGYIGYGPLVFTGRLKRKLKLRLVHSTSKNLCLWAGYLQGIKRAAQSAPKSFILNTMLDHKKRLQKQHLHESLPLESRYWEGIFGGFHPKKPRLYEASPSAAWEAVRSSGGAREYIRKTFRSAFDNETTGALFSGVGEMVSMEETTQGVKTVYGLMAPTFDEVLDMNHELSCSKPTASTVLSGRSIVYPLLRTRVGAVLEPLKVRLITKGEALPYWLARHWQKELWNYLQSFPQFVLTGTPVREGHLNDLLARENTLKLDWGCEPEIVSGDYSAATDTLKQSWTATCFETSLGKMDEMGLDPIQTMKYRDVLRSVLYSQEVSYPVEFEELADKEGKDLKPFIQKNGQLMGSVLSFPILCYVNLVCYWQALEERFNRKFNPRSLPVLVNGDDILFRADNLLYAIWKRRIGEAGFELSLGKNYKHRSICCICSEFFQLFQGIFRRVGYLNTGLLTNVSKLQHTREVQPIWDTYNYVVSNAVTPERASLRFFHYNKSMIAKLSQIRPGTTLNVFLPRELGGLGFHGTPDHITNFQRRLALFLWTRYKDLDSKAPKPMITLQTLEHGDEFFRIHNPSLVLMPLIGPAPIHVVDVTDPLIRLPILTSQYITSELGYKFDLKSLRDFRCAYSEGKTHVWRDKVFDDGVSLMHFPYRLMENEYVGFRSLYDYTAAYNDVENWLPDPGVF